MEYQQAAEPPVSVPGVDPDLMARYEALRNGPDAARVAEAIAGDWRRAASLLWAEDWDSPEDVVYDEVQPWPPLTRP